MLENRLIRILVERDNMSEKEASEVVNELSERMMEGEDPEELLYEIGLEPDYIDDLF